MNYQKESLRNWLNLPTAFRKSRQEHTFQYPGKGSTLLHIAAAYGLKGMLYERIRRHRETTKSLDLRDAESRTPLWWAACNGHVEEAKILIQYLKARTGSQSAQTRANSDAPLCIAAEHGRLDVVDLLLADAKPNINCRNVYGRTPLATAAAQGHDRVVQRLLEEEMIDADASDNWDETPWTLAVSNGNTNVLKLLATRLDVDFNHLDENGNTPLVAAVTAGDADVVATLLASGVVDEYNEAGHNLLRRLAPLIDNTTVWKVLLEHITIDLNARDGRGATLLADTFQDSDMRTAELLLSHGDIDVNARDDYGRTPLHLAVSLRYAWYHEKVFETLVARPDIELNARDSKGRTPLLAALDGYRPHHEVLRQLLRHNRVDIHAADHEGRTPLSVATARITQPDINHNTMQFVVTQIRLRIAMGDASPGG